MQYNEISITILKRYIKALKADKKLNTIIAKKKINKIINEILKKWNKDHSFIIPSWLSCSRLVFIDKAKNSSNANSPSNLEDLRPIAISCLIPKLIEALLQDRFMKKIRYYRLLNKH